MEFQPLVDQLPALRKEAESWKQREEEAQKKRIGLEQIIRGIERLAGVDRSAISEVATVTARATITAQESITPAKPPRGIGAVRRVISEEPDRPWKAGEVHDELVKRGWISEAAQFPQRGTEAAINRLWHGGELERVDRGRYRATPKMKEVPPED